MLVAVIIAAIVITVFGAYLSYCRSETGSFIVLMSLVSLLMGMLWAVLIKQLHGNKSMILATSLTWDVAVITIYAGFPLLLGYRPNVWMIAGFVLCVAGIICAQLGVEH